MQRPCRPHFNELLNITSKHTFKTTIKSPAALAKKAFCITIFYVGVYESKKICLWCALTVAHNSPTKVPHWQIDAKRQNQHKSAYKHHQNRLNSGRQALDAVVSFAVVHISNFI